MLPAITNMKTSITSEGKVASPLLSPSDGRTKLNKIQGQGSGNYISTCFLFIIVNNIQSKGRFALPILFPLAGDRNIAKSWDRAMTMSTFYTIRYISMSTISKARVAQHPHCCRNLLGTETEITSPSPRPGAHFLSQSELRAYFANFDNFDNYKVIFLQSQKVRNGILLTTISILSLQKSRCTYCSTI